VRNPDEKLGDRTQGRTYLPDHLIRVNDAAKRSRQTRFTALLHHIDVEALERAFRRLRRKAAPGVDGMTVEIYEGRLRIISASFATGSIAAGTIRCRFAGRTSPRLTAESGLSPPRLGRSCPPGRGCRSRAMLKGRCPAQSCRPRHLNETARSAGPCRDSRSGCSPGRRARVAEVAAVLGVSRRLLTRSRGSREGHHGVGQFGGLRPGAKMGWQRWQGWQSFLLLFID
jgi:hypothetical protein